MRNCIAVTAALLALCYTSSVQAQTFSSPAGAANVANGGAFSTNSSWGDFDGDGDLDAYVTNWVSLPDPLYQNNGDGSFTDVAAAVGVKDLGNSVAAAWGDYDNDGDLDLYVVDFRVQDQIFENTDGSFAEIGRTNQLINLIKLGSETSVAWGDYDNDGFLDLYVGKYYHDNELYHNSGDGRFERITDLGVSDRRDTNGFSWVEYDNDGDLDLYVVNRDQENGLYRNDLADGGVFAERACALSVANTETGQSGTWGDYDNDGDLDLFLANVGANNLYRNDGAETFVDVANDAGVRQASSGWITTMAMWTDYDGDGWLDLYAATGGDEGQQVDVLFASNGNGTFRNATAEALLSTAPSAHLSTTWVDYNGDGAPDLYSTDGGGIGNILSLNDTPDELFIKVTVRGKGAAAGGNNLFGLGSQVRLFDAETDALVAYRQVLSSSSPGEVTFGAPSGPYNVQVRFPGNEIPMIVGNVSGGESITIEEP
jgi:hypothetical protein